MAPFLDDVISLWVNDTIILHMVPFFKLGDTGAFRCNSFSDGSPHWTGLGWHCTLKPHPSMYRSENRGKYGMARQGGGMGVPPVEEALEAAGLWPMKEYTRRRKVTIEEWIIIIPIYETCTGAERLQGTSQLIRWWGHNHSQMEGENGFTGEEACEVEWRGPRLLGNKKSLKYCAVSVT